MEYNLPVFFNTPNIEAGDESTIPAYGEPYTHGLEVLAFKFPNVRFIVNAFWPHIIEIMKKHPNVIIESGARNGVTHSIFLVSELGPTRICFGSESPIGHPAAGIEEIVTTKLAQVYKDMLLGKNAERIFKDLFVT